MDQCITTKIQFFYYSLDDGCPLGIFKEEVLGTERNHRRMSRLITTKIHRMVLHAMLCVIRRRRHKKIRTFSGTMKKGTQRMQSSTSLENEKRKKVLHEGEIILPCLSINFYTS